MSARQSVLLISAVTIIVFKQFINTEGTNTSPPHFLYVFIHERMPLMKMRLVYYEIMKYATEQTSHSQIVSLYLYCFSEGNTFAFHYSTSYMGKHKVTSQIQ